MASVTTAAGVEVSPLPDSPTVELGDVATLLAAAPMLK
jgi:hypothetical protein